MRLVCDGWFPERVRGRCLRTAIWRDRVVRVGARAAVWCPLHARGRDAEPLKPMPHAEGCALTDGLRFCSCGANDPPAPLADARAGGEGEA
jgi:hypothetical protein